jgi:hypothetical protein
MKRIFLFDILIIYLCHSDALYVVSQQKPCSQVLPFHAAELALNSPNNCSWTCNSGYFSTTPTNPGGISTCRACTQHQNCRIGYFQTQCLDTSDSLCVPCTPLSQIANRDGEVYIEPNTCRVTGCNDGWKLEHGNQSDAIQQKKCKPCPIGRYCIQGIAHSCGTNCSTEYESSFSPLQCKQTSGSEMTFYIRSTISGNGLMTIKETQCYDLNNDIINWLQYGILQGCIINIISPSMGTLTCTILAAQCIASNYLQWILENIILHKVQTEALLSTCLNAPGITLGQPQIQQTVLSSSVSQNAPSSHLVTPPTDSPLLIIEPSKWGHSRGEILSATSLMFFICIGLFLVLVLVCGLWAVKSSTQTSVRDLFRLLSNRHEEKLSIDHIWPQVRNKKKDIP